MTNLSIATEAPSPGAERMRRHRWLRRQGAVNISILLGADAVQRLTELRWLASADRANPAAVTSAVVRLAAHALGFTAPGRAEGREPASTQTPMWAPPTQKPREREVGRVFGQRFR